MRRQGAHYMFIYPALILIHNGRIYPKVE